MKSKKVNNRESKTSSKNKWEELMSLKDMIVSRKDLKLLYEQEN